MPQSVTAVRVGVDGVVSVAPFGATAPTSAVSALTGYTDYGYVSEDGVTETTNATTDKIRAWQKAKVVRTTVTEGSIQWKFVLIQTDAAAVALYYGGTVQPDGSIVIDPTAVRPLLAIVIDVIDGTEIIRSYAPEAQVTEVGDVVYQNGAPIGYEVTIEANYNLALLGSAKKWFNSMATPAVPTLSTALPTAVSVGNYVRIVGTGFTSVVGVAGVKFGGVNATSYDINGDNEIYAIMPAGSAGSAPVIVTNPGGASSPLAYTRGA